MMLRLDRRLISIAAIACAIPSARTSAQSAPGAVLDEMLITEGAGGFAAELDDYDEFGSAVASIGDLDGDGRDELAVGAAGDGAVWILFFDAAGTVRSQTELTPPPVQQMPFWYGRSLASIGDLDGDGVEELAVGAPDFGVPLGGGPGAVWILFLDHDASVKSTREISSGTGGLVGPLPGTAQFGTGVAAIGDLDGNGVTELAVGSPGDPDGASGSNPDGVGAVWILFLAADGHVIAEQKVSASHGGFPGTLGPGPSEFGTSVALIGDIDQDGAPELAVGADANFGSGGTPAVWIVSIEADGTVGDASQITTNDPVFEGSVPYNDGFGWAVAGPGDLDADGVRDLVVGAPFGGTGGSIWELFLQRDATVEHAVRIGDFAGLSPGALEPKDNLGSGLGTIRMNGPDGLLTLAAGARGEGDDFDPEIGDYDYTGGVWILSLDAGAATGSWDWVDGALAGSNGLPVLSGDGPQVPGIDAELHLSKSKPNSLTLVVVGLALGNTPLLGGTLVPTPDVLLPFQTNANGKLNLHGDWPSGIPTGQPVYFQCWIADPAGPEGYSASNALAAIAL